MIHILKQRIKINLVFLFMMVIVSIRAMENDNLLVAKALLDEKCFSATNVNYDQEASLADCLRDNHHAAVYSTMFSGGDGNYLAFSTYGRDALQWIIPKTDSKDDEDAAWEELSNALKKIIVRRNITKIVFEIQPEGEKRLQKIKLYSCLMHADSLSLVMSLMKKLPALTLLKSDIKIEYRSLDTRAQNTYHNYFIYYRINNIQSNKYIKVDANITLKMLFENTSNKKFFVTEHDNKAENISDAGKQGAHILFYVICGGTGLAIFFIGWWYLQRCLLNR